VGGHTGSGQQSLLAAQVHAASVALAHGLCALRPLVAVLAGSMSNGMHAQHLSNSLVLL
jgi:hypothetical protein